MLPTRQNVFRIVSKCPKMSQDVPKCQKMSKNVRADYGRKWSEMTGKTVLMLQTRQKVFRIVPKCPKLSQNVPKCPIQTHRYPNGLVSSETENL